MEKIPRQDGGSLIPAGVDRRPAPALAGTVNHIVMEQAGGVEIFKGNGQAGHTCWLDCRNRAMVATGLGFYQAGGEQGQQGPDALAPGKQGVIQHRRQPRLAHHRQIVPHHLIDVLDLGD